MKWGAAPQAPHSESKVPYSAKGDVQPEERVCDDGCKTGGILSSCQVSDLFSSIPYLQTPRNGRPSSGIRGVFTQARKTLHDLTMGGNRT